MDQDLLAKIYQQNLVTIVTQEIIETIITKNIKDLIKIETIDIKEYTRMRAYVQQPDGGIVAYSGLGITAEDAINFSYQMLDKQGNPVSDLCCYHAAAIPGVPPVSTPQKAFYWQFTKENPQNLAIRLEAYKKLPLELQKIFDGKFGCITDDLYGFRENAQGKRSSGMNLEILLAGKAALLAAEYPEHPAFRDMCTPFIP